MALSNDEVIQILSIIENSSFDSIEMQMGDLRLVASKNGPLQSAVAVSAAPLQYPPPAPAAREQSGSTSQNPGTQDTAEPASVNEAGLVEITAPIVGTFYSASEPGSAPFVNEGDEINEDSTVGIIEVMKVFTNIRAETKGTVVRCLVGDGDFVEFGQPLFLIRPEA